LTLPSEASQPACSGSRSSVGSVASVLLFQYRHDLSEWIPVVNELGCFRAESGNLTKVIAFKIVQTQAMVNSSAGEHM
jgi:hypothetical protein